MTVNRVEKGIEKETGIISKPGGKGDRKGDGN